MAATGVEQVVKQIAHFKETARLVVVVQNQIFQLLENEEVVTQTWNNLHQDFPSLFTGTNPTSDSLIIGETFTPTHIKQAKNKIQDISDFLQGTAITVTGNPGRNIRRLTEGVV